MDQEMVCENCMFFVLDVRKKTFGRCFLKPPIPIVRKDMDGESIKTTRPITYASDFCGSFEYDDGASRREYAADRGKRNG